MKQLSHGDLKRIRSRLRFLYGDEAEALTQRFYHLVGRYGVDAKPERRPVQRWNQRDCMLITYADMVQPDSVADGSPLRQLKNFCDHHLKGAVSTVHLLPFYPWSSDDGFSVKDYRAVEPDYGDWKDVESLREHFQLAFDLVLNHCSAESSWFRDFGMGIAPGKHYFLEMDPETDLDAVFRPRASPLLTETRTRYGVAHVWTTFSADQVDLNWQNPDLLFEFLDILFKYISHGVRILRLDAVAFCWKKQGTSCIHLPETHEIVKLLRDICEMVAPEVIILTETNVPHAENVSYFGDGDEAHMVYNFSLAPLVLEALLRNNGTWLTKWASQLEYPEGGCTYLNFTASHDGVGVGPLKGLLPEDRFEDLLATITRRGGMVSTKRNSDGTESPYELNITYASALMEDVDDTAGWDRFLCSQGIALGLKGIPAVYFHSLMGTQNNLEGLKQTGRARTLNRYKYSAGELESLLKEEGPFSFHFERLTQLMRRRNGYPAFHPDGDQEIIDRGPDWFVIRRHSKAGEQSVTCLYNLTEKAKQLTPDFLRQLNHGEGRYHDIVSGKTLSLGKKASRLRPYQFLWLVAR